MLGSIALLASLASFVAGQQAEYSPKTGVRSLWIPYKTVSGTPVASIASEEVLKEPYGEPQNATVYVISCPTASPGCAIAPNITLTEGASTVRYISTNSAGAATLHCALTGFTTGTCYQDAEGHGNIQRTSATVDSSQILYQAVDVTMTQNNTSTQPVTITVTPTPSTTSTSSTSSSTAGARTMDSGPFAMGGAIGAGLMALAAL